MTTVPDAAPFAGVEDAHDDHPVRTALLGFYTGLVLVIVVPGVYGAILASTVSGERATELFPLVLFAFALPIMLAAVPRTRRFGGYLALGMVSTAVVVGGVAALVLWLMIGRGV